MLGPLVSEFDAYAAGLIDGEGQVTAWMRPRREDGRRHEMQSAITIAVTMTDRRAVDLLAQHYGGRVYELDPPSRSPTCKIAYRWQVTDATAARVLDAVGPYLVVKADQARLCQEFRDTKMQGGRAKPVRRQQNDELKARRVEIIAEIRRLNRRGTKAA